MERAREGAGEEPRANLPMLGWPGFQIGWPSQAEPHALTRNPSSFPCLEKLNRGKRESFCTCSEARNTTGCCPSSSVYSKKDFLPRGLGGKKPKPSLPWLI